MMRLLLPLATLALTACTSVQVPSCEQIIRGADTVEELASVLAGLGYEPEKAARISELAGRGADIARLVCSATARTPSSRSAPPSPAR